MLTSNLKKEKPMEVGRILPNLPPSPLLVLHKGSSVLRSYVPTLPMAVPSSKTRKQPFWGKGSTCEMAKPQGKGTPSRAGYCKRQPSTKQQRVVTGSAGLPSRKQPHGPSLLRRGKPTEASGQQGAGRVQPSGRSGKQTVNM